MPRQPWPSDPGVDDRNREAILVFERQSIYFGQEQMFLIELIQTGSNELLPEFLAHSFFWLPANSCHLNYVTNCETQCLLLLFWFSVSIRMFIVPLPPSSSQIMVICIPFIHSWNLHPLLGIKMLITAIKCRLSLYTPRLLLSSSSWQLAGETNEVANEIDSSEP